VRELGVGRESEGEGEGRESVTDRAEEGATYMLAQQGEKTTHRMYLFEIGSLDTILHWFSSSTLLIVICSPS
jgi:Holliday junction resolvase-like predicted endonuclease